MAHEIDINGLRCLCTDGRRGNKIAYILYPMEGYLDHWIDVAAEKYNTDIVVITSMDWQNVFSPWPAVGVPAGTPDFKGESPEFLKALQDTAIPLLERYMGFKTTPYRTLVGVSMSGLFALWQWMVCDTFGDIASLSGSFWYEGFLDWFKARVDVTHKSGRAYFLLGDKEAATTVKGFKSVAVNTNAIVEMLEQDGVRVKFESVPGNHYANPLPRLEAAFDALYL